MKNLLPLLFLAPLLTACGDKIESAWTGTCEATIGTLEIITGELSEAPPRQDVTGEHDHYSTPLAEISYPAGDVFQTAFSFVYCIDEGGCSTPTDDFADGDAYLTFQAEGQQAQIVAFGPLKGKKVEGTCETFFGTDSFFLQRTGKGLE